MFDGPMFYISFVKNTPEESVFIGACVIHAQCSAIATFQARLYGCNPGGAAKVIDVSDYNLDNSYKNKLLNSEEAENLPLVLAK
jgi:hypothetical protein